MDFTFAFVRSPVYAYHSGKMTKHKRIGELINNTELLSRRFNYHLRDTMGSMALLALIEETFFYCVLPMVDTGVPGKRFTSLKHPLEIELGLLRGLRSLNNPRPSHLCRLWSPWWDPKECTNNRTFLICKKYVCQLLIR